MKTLEIVMRVVAWLIICMVVVPLRITYIVLSMLIILPIICIASRISYTDAQKIYWTAVANTLKSELHWILTGEIKKYD